jgi:starch synthase (maltosyl-transferring)
VPERIVIEAVGPVVEDGRQPVRATVGQCLPIRATVRRDGDDPISVVAVWRPEDHTGDPLRIPMTPLSSQRDDWQATVVPDRPGRYTFHVEAWVDPWARWRRSVAAKRAAGQQAAELADDLVRGARLLDRVATRGAAGSRTWQLAVAAAALRNPVRPLADRLAPALDAEVSALLASHPLPEHTTRGEDRTVHVEVGDGPAGQRWRRPTGTGPEQSAERVLSLTGERAESPR